MTKTSRVENWLGKVVSPKSENTSVITKMKNRACELCDDAKAEHLNKEQYVSLMQIKAYAGQLKMQTKLAALQSRIDDLQRAELSPVELVDKLSAIECEIDAIVSTFAPKANNVQRVA